MSGSWTPWILSAKRASRSWPRTPRCATCGPSAPEGITFNIIDTPGHADFGGEVERGLEMVDGVVLLVDASEGPLPQTRFVLRKALQKNLPVVLVINKVDRPDSRIAEVVDEAYELFLDLDANENQIEFPIVYTSAKAGRASLTRPADGGMPEEEDLEPLFRTLVETIPAPTYTEGAPLQAHVTNLDASPYLGRLALCRVHQGTINKGQQVAWIQADGTVNRMKVVELLMTEALTRVPLKVPDPETLSPSRGSLRSQLVTPWLTQKTPSRFP